MEEHDNFAEISWQSSEPSAQLSPSTRNTTTIESDSLGASKNDNGKLSQKSYPVDFDGIGEGMIECKVTQPIKENDGTKDAYVSYVVTTNVHTSLSENYILTHPDNILNVSKAKDLSSTTIHRFCLSLQNSLTRIPCLRSSACS